MFQILAYALKGMEVALLTEGVDRNLVVGKAPGLIVKSPSSRRAWIEISPCW